MPVITIIASPFAIVSLLRGEVNVMAGLSLGLATKIVMVVSLVEDRPPTLALLVASALKVCVPFSKLFNKASPDPQS